MSTFEAPSTRDLDAAVVALVEIGGHLSQIVAHMADAPARRGPAGQTAVPIPQKLSGFLVETLEPVAVARSPEDIATIAAFLADVQRTMAEEIFLVPHEPHGRRRGSKPPRRR